MLYKTPATYITTGKHANVKTEIMGCRLNYKARIFFINAI